MYFLFPKLLVSIFGLGLWQGEKIDQGRKTKKNSP
jgi:hypothetical protein